MKKKDMTGEGGGKHRSGDTLDVPAGRGARGNALPGGDGGDYNWTLLSRAGQKTALKVTGLGRRLNFRQHPRSEFQAAGLWVADSAEALSPRQRPGCEFQAAGLLVASSSWPLICCRQRPGSEVFQATGL